MDDVANFENLRDFIELAIQKRPWCNTYGDFLLNFLQIFDVESPHRVIFTCITLKPGCHR